MDNRKLHRLLYLLLLAILAASCKDTMYEEGTYMANIPVYISRADLIKQTAVTSPKNIQTFGKTEVSGNYLVINEPFAGLHILDITDLKSPSLISSIRIPGNVDFTIHNGFIYADNLTDLLKIDVRDFRNPMIVERVEELFPNNVPEFNLNLPVYGFDKVNGIVTGWNEEAVTENFSDLNARSGVVAYYNSAGGFSIGVEKVNPVRKFDYRRIKSENGYLYAVNGDQVAFFNLASQPNLVPEYESPNYVTSGIFADGEKVYMLTDIGLLQYRNSGNQLTFLRTEPRITSCNTVEIRQTNIYTADSETAGCGKTGTLKYYKEATDRINLKRQIDSEEAAYIHASGNYIFVAMKASGVHIFDKLTLQPVHKIGEMNAVYMNIEGNILYISASSSLAIYNIANPAAPVLLSKLQFQQND